MHHRIKKGAKHSIRANVSTEGYVIETLPKLFANLETTGRDPCNLEYPKDVSRLMVCVTAFFDAAVDLCECKSDSEETYWLANCGRMIGVPLSRARRLNREMSLDGNIRHFMTESDVADKPSSYYWRAAKSMIDATKNICRLSWKNGIIVGDCIDCWKYLGYGCPGAAYLRSKNNMLDQSLENKRKVKCNSRGLVAKALVRGSQYDMYTGGRSTVTGKRRKAPEMLKSNEAFLQSLTYPQLRDTARYLGILKECVVDDKITREKMIAVLVEDFYKDPVSYRIKQNGVARVDPADLDDLSEASFDVCDAMESFEEDDGGFLEKFNVDSIM
ncbi:hypothetical protein SEMRO_1875_G303030.1 [Seminavis robusta]|uniref:Uncharacterized protein n=1 Tax=Seminavis robusta TaxID=568900 RepID=A0A9N8HV56_9STRA|nr:hypothetical protein SEMRO_1875_G303030.1 [Seminavis robusta]|eukprot:Sro1875_g303030.1 n/a (329) ;mRNA; f:14098-15084